jgi:Fe-S-cluster-containing dehydrogenase component
MARYGMSIDVDKCTGCYACFLACRDEFVGNDYRPLSAAQPETGQQQWIQVREQERGSYPKVKVSYVPVPCVQCADAPCIKAATGGAIYRRPDGIVVIDPEKAAGQRAIVDACPFGAIFWNAELNLPQKCTFCAHLIDGGWKEPRCAEACPTQAIIFGDLDDPQSKVAQLRSAPSREELLPELKVSPLVTYLNLPARFIAGEIVFADRPDEPAAGVNVTLSLDAQKWSTSTDGYGDFEFERLPADIEFTLEIASPGYRPCQLRVQTSADINLGDIVLQRAD